MSKTKNLGPGHYELLFIIPNNYTEEEAEQINKKTEKMITEAGGEITYQEVWGKKKLAYPIKHNNYGYYFLFEFNLSGEKLADLNNSFRLSSEILRHQMVRCPQRSKEEIVATKALQKKVSSKKEKETSSKEEGIKTPQIKKAVPTPELDQEKTLIGEEKGKTKKASQDNKAELKDLDQKLEGILNAKDMI